jgi:hypothetical protein
MNDKNAYMESVYKYGRIWNLSVMVLLFLFPVSVWLIFDAAPDWHGLLLGLLATAPMYWAVAVVETFTYIPMLGAGGSYLSFVTGNISNLKLPVALNALEQAGVKVNSEEGEVVSTIAIAVSSIVTTVIIIIGVVLITPLTPVLNAPVLAPAFAQIIPALFGGLGVVFISKNWKIADSAHRADAGAVHLRAGHKRGHGGHHGAGGRGVHAGRVPVHVQKRPAGLREELK